MNYIYQFLEIFVVTLFYYVLAILTTQILDFTENKFTDNNQKKKSIIRLIFEIVFRLSLNGFLINYIPLILIFLNTRIFYGIINKDIIFKSAVIYSITNITFDSNLLSKFTELKYRIH